MTINIEDSNHQIHGTDAARSGTFYDFDAKPTNVRAPVVFSTRHGPLSDVERAPWPRLGGIKDNTFTGHAFETAFLERFEPGDEAVGYIAGCEMLRSRAAAYHLPLAKAGWSALPDLLDRQEDLNRDKYGGWRWIEGQLVEQLGCHWEMQRAQLSFVPHPRSPVRLVDRGIAVRLPRSYSVREFEKDMHRSMQASSLVAFVKSRAGQAHFRKLGIEPSAVPHHTVYHFGSGRRTNVAVELYIMRPRTDFSRIALLAERLVLARVLNLANEASR